ncbi:MAG: GTPase Era [Chloroflexota bacterium]
MPDFDDPFEFFDELPEDLEATPLLEDDLPPDHRSGFVAVIGRPNVGKSTLMNHLLGQKIAIVSPKPQTTRNQLLGILTLPTPDQPELAATGPPAQIIFMDTPGIHRPLHKLGEYLVETALETIPDADLILWLVDLTEPPTAEDQLVAATIGKAQTKLKKQGEPPIAVLLVLNKIDLLSPAALALAAAPFLELLAVLSPTPVTEANYLFVSATRGDNHTELLRQIIHRLPPGPRYFPAEQVTDQQTRFIAAELIREAALKVLHQEVPHALAVQVVEFTPRHEQLTYVSANLVLERPSQKGIVIGEKGQTLKRIGQLARPEIEKLVGTKVYLELWVKIRPQWRKKDNELRWLGYSKP